MRKILFIILLLTLSFSLFSLWMKKEVAVRQDTPNILIAISDDQSYPHSSIYGSKVVKTPGFDLVASEGILFKNAFTAAPGCSPSRASLLTGKHIWELEDAGSHASQFPLRFKTFTDILDSVGYHVGYTGKGWGPGNWKISGRTRNPAGDAYNEYKDEQVAQNISTNNYARNFEAFLKNRDRKQPFCFWFGAYEPHRRYETGIGQKSGMDMEDVVVPGFLPDAPEIQSNMLDYLFEIQHFDTHLMQMLKYLEEIDELDNTIVIVTSDNGMPFPRAKANLYEYGIHVPLAICWGDKIIPGRKVDDLISLTDVAPTLMDLILSENNGIFNMSGKSFSQLLFASGSGLIEPQREYVYSARERHSSSRWKNFSYPIRAVRTHGFLYVKNMKPERWPAGAPVKYGRTGELENGFHDIDDFQESFIFQNRGVDSVKYFFDLAVAKRPLEELYNVKDDPFCLNELSDLPEYQEILLKLRKNLKERLLETGDPRILDNGDVWESYIRYSPIRNFPIPDWVSDTLGTID